MPLRRFSTHLTLGLLAFGCAWSWNSWNIRAMQRALPDQLRYGVSVMTTDDASYLSAVDRLVDPPQDVQEPRIDLRAPGYRLWYLVPRVFLSIPAALRVLIVLQCLLFACSVALLWEVLLVFGIAPLVRWTCALLLAIVPTFHGFLFYTLTEAVTPALVLGTVCCALLAKRAKGHGWLWAAGALWALLMVTRPVLAWAGLPLLHVLWSHSGGWKGVRRVVLVGALAFVPTGLWWASNMRIAGGYVGIHPVYRADEPGINRPTHEAFWELAKSWGTPGDAFHSIMEPAFQAALAGDTARTFAQQYIATAPAGGITPAQEDAVRAEFIAWQRFTCLSLAPALAGAERTLAAQPEEQRIIAHVNMLTREYRSAHAWHYHVEVPVHVLRQLVAHSNLNLYLFQHTLRGRALVEALRWCSAVLHAALLLGLFLAVWWCIDPTVRTAALGAAVYLLYLAYVQRGIEERYTLPALNLAVLCAAFMSDAIARGWAAWRAARRSVNS